MWRRPGPSSAWAVRVRGHLIAVLASRPDVDVVGVDVSTARCRAAERAARALGVDERIRVVAGSAFEIDLPPLPSVVANPPMLPTEPGFAFSRGDGGRDLFWMRLLETVSV